MNLCTSLPASRLSRPDNLQETVQGSRNAGPFTWTRDPFDRIITAQDMVSHAPLITKDGAILSHYKRAIWDSYNYFQS
jgi:PIN domain nuclease of toxin-antitoxin system